MTNAYSKFESNIASASILERIYEYLSKKTLPFEPDELLRAEFVMLVGAFDCYVHDYVRGKMVNAFNNPSTMANKTRDYKVSLGVMMDIMNESNPISRMQMLESEIKKIESSLTAPLKTTEKLERYYKIHDFDIDRHWTEKADMRAAIENQWLETQKWGKNLNETTEEPYPYTVFRYEHETERAKQNAAEAFKDAPCMVPYVLLLNPQIESIEFIDETEGCHVVYEMPQCQPEKVEELTDGVVYRNIVTKSSSIDGEKQLWMYYIESKEKNDKAPEIPKITVVLPVKEKEGKLHVFQFQHELPQIYIYLPLLGTEQWGFNYLLHSSMFTCDRDSRDSLRLVGNGQNNDYQAEDNRKLIDLANKLIWQYVQKNIGKLADAKYLVLVNFKTQQSDEELAEYYRGLQKLWRERYESLEIVSTGEESLL